MGVLLKTNNFDTPMKLDDRQCKTAETREKPYKLSDGAGLYLQITPKGSKYWRYKYRHLGVEKLLAFGTYPQTSLKEAREQRLAARKLLDKDIDPSAAKKEDKREKRLNSANTFEAIAREWHLHKQPEWQLKHAKTILTRLEADIFPEIGKLPIRDVTSPILLEVMRRIEARGALEVSKRCNQYCGQIFRYAIQTGRADYDITTTFKGALKTRPVKHHAAIDPQQISKLLNDLQNAQLSKITRLAFELMFLTFVRTHELRHAKIDQFDFEKKVWIVPVEYSKMRRKHTVPLSKQALKVIEQLQVINGYREWLFASPNKPKQPICENTLLTALYRMGYKGTMTGHGFRALALTALQEKLGYPHEVADLQLAHKKPHSLGEAYDRAQFLDQRAVMMQDGANYLDTAKQ